MAYGRRYRKRYYRRRRTLSNYNIAVKTSAKAQARQIYAMKRRINYIQRLTKPEIRVKQFEQNAEIGLTGTGGTGIVNWATPTGTNPVIDAFRTTLSGGSDGSATTSTLGDFVRNNSFTLYGTAQFDDTVLSATTVPIVFRVVILQYGRSRSDAIVPADVFNEVSSPLGASGNASNAVFGPLQNGVSGRTLK